MVNTHNNYQFTHVKLRLHNCQRNCKRPTNCCASQTSGKMFGFKAHDRN